MTPEISISEATTLAQQQTVKSLLRDFQLYLHRNWRRAPRNILSHVGSPEWDSELSDLNGHYGEPYGAIVLAQVGIVPAGCLLMRGISEASCEIRVQFVRPAFAALNLQDNMKILASELATKRGYKFLDGEPLLELAAHQPLAVASPSRRAIVTLASRNVPSSAHCP